MAELSTYCLHRHLSTLGSLRRGASWILLSLAAWLSGCQNSDLERHPDPAQVAIESQTDLETIPTNTASSTIPVGDSVVGILSTESMELNVAAVKESLFCIDKSAHFATEHDPYASCKQISARLASVTFDACMKSNLNWSGCNSVNGFPIYVSEFEPLSSREPQGKILVIGGMHGDELTSVSVVFRWIEKLNRYHSGLFHWRVAPMMNPDGVLPKSAQRTNARGVDLNRNMPSSDWNDKAMFYWETKTDRDERKFPGNAPASEPESQWLIDEINSFKPDAIISVHAPYGIVDFDALELDTAPQSLGKLRLNLLGTYPGSLGNYAGINKDIPVITLELPHAWVMPSHDESTRIWEDIVAWLKKNIDTRQVNIP